MVGAESEAIDGAGGNDSLPLAGVSLAPDGRLIGLSHGDWDVHGGPGLYELLIESNGVRATHLTQLDVPLSAIEFLDDGTLIGAGEALYEVDLATGATEEIGTVGIDIIADMDHAPDGVLYGTTLPAEGDSQLVELLSDAELGPPISMQPPGRRWGLAIRQRSQVAEFAPTISTPVRRRSAQ